MDVPPHKCERPNRVISRTFSPSRACAGEGHRVHPGLTSDSLSNERAVLPNHPPVIIDLISTLEQGKRLVHDMSDSDYARAPHRLQASSFGAHYRHHIEHVQLLLSGWADGVVDYDSRPRDACVEQHRDVALSRTDELIEKLDALTDEDLDRAIEIAHRTSVERGPISAPTTLRRELLFMVSHAVHHYALMKIIAESFGHAPDQDFGVMPSTLAHQSGCDQARQDDAVAGE